MYYVLVRCETGELAGTTPTEHCCGPDMDACAHCNRTGRCTPADASRGDPREQFGRRERLETYLMRKARPHGRTHCLLLTTAHLLLAM